MMNTTKLCSQDLCTGCFACKQVCAKGAISIKEVNGFLYPKIDTSLCVNCGLCTKTCPVLREDKTVLTVTQSICYAIWHNKDDIRMNSSSGGVFSALAERTLQEEGVVYGAAWDENMQLKHVGVDDIKNIDSIRRSKYVQSHTDGIYKDVKHQLMSGRQTLFCGTPCQIAGLLSFLGKEYQNLITVGVVCHGVPSQTSFDKYIREIEEDKKVKVYDCNFRSKKYGWTTSNLLLLLLCRRGNKEVIINKAGAGNPYMNAFMGKYFLRESCYNCSFKGDGQRYNADIMLSDFWSLWSAVPWRDVDWGKGVSSVIANNEKGREYLKRCVSSLSIMERPYSEYSTNTGLKVTIKPANNDEAMEFLQTNTWGKTQSVFFPLRFSKRLVFYLRRLLGENYIVLIKKIVKKIR